MAQVTGSRPKDSRALHGHTKMDGTIHYLETEDALSLSEHRPLNTCQPAHRSSQPLADDQAGDGAAR